MTYSSTGLHILPLHTRRSPHSPPHHLSMHGTQQNTTSELQDVSGHGLRMTGPISALESGPLAVSGLQELSSGLANGWGWMWVWLEGKPCQQEASQALATVSGTWQCHVLNARCRNHQCGALFVPLAAQMWP
jgi:hypothetical protein